MESNLTPEVKTFRSQASWTFIYVMLGFALVIGGTFIQMFPLAFPGNVIVYIVFSAWTIWLFIFNGRFQDKLIGLKDGYEGKPR